MKKNNLRTLFSLSAGLIFIFLPQISYSQTPAPADWEAFVKSASLNTLAKDTFLFQSFEQDVNDTWHYETEGNARFGDVSSLYGLKGQGGNRSLLLFPDSRVKFDSLDLSPAYQDVLIQATLAASRLQKGDAFFVEAFRGGVGNRWEWSRSARDNNSINYRGNIRVPDGIMSNPIQIPNNPSSFRLTTPVSNTGTCYCVDSVYAVGSIPRYSLFGGTGDWSDTVLWSHLPALRHRNALIKGTVSVSSDIRCGDVAVSGGSVFVGRNATFTADNLSLYFSDLQSGSVTYGSLQAEGEVNIRGCVTIYRTFPEKGKWYFVSFPFDVYADGLDPDFEWKDDEPNAGGNYFYVCTYNGERRAATAGISNDWDVLKPDVSSSSLVFEKNRGYLIALDGRASVQTLSFSSSESVSPGFGKCISIPVQSPPAGTSEDNNGWCLCGNPLPASLPLNSMEPNPRLDGYVYVLEEGGYKPYAIGSQYALPPLSAFFVKAKGDTEILFSASNRMGDPILLPCSSPLPVAFPEPVVNSGTSLAEGRPFTDEIKKYREGNRLYLENISGNGTVQVVEVSGCVLEEQKVERGFAVVELPRPSGLYIIKIQTECYHSCFKLVKAM